MVQCDMTALTRLIRTVMRDYLFASCCTHAGMMDRIVHWLVGKVTHHQ